MTHRDDDRTAQFESYRDASFFVYRDVLGKQILSQWLLDETGTTYWNRACRIGDKGGVLWNTCSAWGSAHDIADLGLPAFGPLAGINSYVWAETDAAGYVHQQLAQTVFNERGDSRMGRVCPIQRTVLWDECSDWRKLATSTEEMAVPGALTLRDDFWFSYENGDGESVFVQSVLSIDGSLMWDRHCVTYQGNPGIPSWQCGFGARAPLKDFGIRMGAVAGGGQYVYTDATGPVLAQTFISVDGTKGYHRACPISPKGVDWKACEPFTASTLTQLRVTQAPL